MKIVIPGGTGQVGAVLVRAFRGLGAEALSLHTTDLMRVVKAMYERMGFVRAPGLDFEPAPGILIQGFRLRLTPDVH